MSNLTSLTLIMTDPVTQKSEKIQGKNIIDYSKRDVLRFYTINILYTLENLSPMWAKVQIDEAEE